MGIELTRESRGAQFWLPLRAHGVEAYAAHLEWCLDAVQWLAAELDSSPHLEIVTEPTLCTFTCRVRVEAANVSSDALAQWLVDDVNSRGALIAPTKVHGSSVVRVCVLSCRTTPEHLEAVGRDIIQAAERVAERAAQEEAAAAGQGLPAVGQAPRLASGEC